MTFKLMDNNKQNMENDERDQSVKLSDFSIDHILNRAGNSVVKSSEETVVCEGRIGGGNMGEFGWLQCSRYCPPKVPRIHRKEVQKRQLGRHPRIPFTSHQLSILEQKFRESPYLSSEEVIVLSRKLQLADIRVKIWFQNRRARERREKNGVYVENRRIEECKSVLEDPVLRCTPDKLPGSSNFSFRSSDTESKAKIDVKCLNLSLSKSKAESDVNSVSSNVNEAFKRLDVATPYFLCNGVANQSVPFFVPYVNFNCVNNREDNES